MTSNATNSSAAITAMPMSAHLMYPHCLNIQGILVGSALQKLAQQHDRAAAERVGCDGDCNILKGQHHP
jgi:hypothetical protein